MYINLPIWSDMDWIPWHQEVAMTVCSTCHTLSIPAQIWSQWGVEEDHPSLKFKFEAFWSFKLSHKSFLQILLGLEWGYCMCAVKLCFDKYVFWQISHVDLITIWFLWWSCNFFLPRNIFGHWAHRNIMKTLQWNKITKTDWISKYRYSIYTLNSRHWKIR